MCFGGGVIWEERQVHEKLGRLMLVLYILNVALFRCLNVQKLFVESDTPLKRNGGEMSRVLMLL